MAIQTMIFHIFKQSIYKLRQLVVLAILLGISSNLMALGLGALEVQSNLDQPLNAIIDLRIQDSDDLSSIKAKIADKKDFAELGIEYAEYMEVLSVNLDEYEGRDILRLSSNDVVINEPFIHLLVRVDYSEGSFLREYTALIDPPVYAAQTPQSVAEPKAVGTDQSYINSDQDDSSIGESNAAEDDVFIDSSSSTSDTTANEESDNIAVDAQYGPVLAGESLSMIAQDLQGQFPDLSIYQIMKVLFDENQDAFIDNNINGLLKGAVLNIGDLNAIRAVDIQDGKNFFVQQLNEWNADFSNTNNFASSDDSLKVGQNEYVDDDYYTSDNTLNDSLEVPAFQVGASTDSNTIISSSEGDTTQAEVVAMQQQITELQSALSSSSLENQELIERISILEGQLADMNRLINLSVENAEMANLEATLAQQNQSRTNAADADISSDQSTDINAAQFEEFGDDNITELDADELVDVSDSEENSARVDSAATGSSDAANAFEDSQGTAPQDSTQSVISSVDDPSSASLSTTTPTKTSFFDMLKSPLSEGGLWKAMLALLAVLLGGLILFFIRRRRADEEFEASMMTIESDNDRFSQTRDDSTNTLETVSVADKTVAEKETSFLTVYSDSDAVVQADEVDPIAEADVYIAYGRDEQAEEVLLDGMTRFPQRVDIKHKLLGLYHKNNNAEDFERIAEELYAQKDSIDAEVWQDVQTKGQTLLPNNPLFLVSSDEISANDKLEIEENNDTTTITVNTDNDDQILPHDGDTEIETLSIDPSTDRSIDEITDELNEEINQIQGVDNREDSTRLEDSSVLEFDSDDLADIELDRLDDSKHKTVEDDKRAEIAQSEDADQLKQNESTLEIEDDTIDIINLDELDIDSETDSTEMTQINTDAQDIADDIAAINADDNTIEIDLSDAVEYDFENVDTVDLELESDSTRSETVSVDSDDSLDLGELSELSELSELEVSNEHDEDRTQYELAKVFFDLGDESGARKILKEIINNKDNDDSLLTDAKELLDNIDS